MSCPLSLFGRAMIFCVLAVGGTAKGADPEEVQAAMVLDAMEAELERNRSLKLDDLEAPYFLSSSTTESTGFDVAASFGALVLRAPRQQLAGTVEVRVGSPQLDN